MQDGVRVMQHVPELAGVELVSTAAQLGVRETRHIEGRYRLVEEDLLGGRRFEDGICVVRFNIDIHAVRPASGTGTIHIEGGRVEPYHIPYRALLPVNREHLLMAGRCISGSSRRARFLPGHRATAWPWARPRARRRRWRCSRASRPRSSIRRFWCGSWRRME